MQQDQYSQINDWFRILFGATSPNFLIEIIFRAFFIYLVLLVSMRMMGKRMANQLSRNEMAALVSMAAAVGVPLLDAHRGLLAAVVIALVIVGVQRLIARLIQDNPRLEAITQDTPSILVENGVLQLDAMRETLVTRERLLAQLRSNSMEHLGQVKRLIIEPNGNFTLIEAQTPQPGLPVIPGWDTRFKPQKSHVSDQLVCRQCGTAKATATNQADSCPHCGDRHWVQSLT
ncbi:DUF421 domain-containing protein [Spirosoma jeollabukense]